MNNHDIKEYGVWAAMLRRCRNPNTKDYPNYGGRGIRVCERWSKFANFYADLGPRPSRNHSIERRENDGNYEPGNCYWATRAEQANNKRNNRLITAHGKTQTLAQWASELRMTPYAITFRLRSGWNVERALSEPAAERPNSKLTASQAAAIKAAYQPHVVSAAKLAKDYGVSKKSVLNVLHGKTFRDAMPASW
jgi:hypothetical protein